jgi:hypothetical protein
VVVNELAYDFITLCSRFENIAKNDLHGLPDGGITLKSSETSNSRVPRSRITRNAYTLNRQFLMAEPILNGVI